MRVHARRRDPELAGDLLGRPTRRDGVQDLSLAVSQGLFHDATIEDLPGKHVAGKKAKK